jgi:translation initiation factor IF-3
LARSLELDLVEVAPMANPPVCRIMDYGKFRYEEAQKAKESRRKSTNVSVKEVKFRPKIGRGDFDVKVRKVDQFIHEGHKVKVTLQFRGREMAHPELGTKILDQVLDVVGEYVKVETQARLEGRNMSMVLSPDKKALDLRKAAGLAPEPLPEGVDLDDDDDDDGDDGDHGDEHIADTDATDATVADATDTAGTDVADVADTDATQRTAP